MTGPIPEQHAIVSALAAAARADDPHQRITAIVGGVFATISRQEQIIDGVRRTLAGTGLFPTPPADVVTAIGYLVSDRDRLAGRYAGLASFVADVIALRDNLDARRQASLDRIIAAATVALTAAGEVPRQ